MTSVPLPSVDVAVRQAGPGDLPQLTALIDRCSHETLYRRFHGATGRSVAHELVRVAAPCDVHRSWVAVTRDGAVRGTATLAWGRSGEAEIAVLVEDAWFRRGLGRRLVGRLAADAWRVGEATIVAWVQADNTRALRFLQAVAPGGRRAFSDGEIVVRIPVAPEGTVAGGRDEAA